MTSALAGATLLLLTAALIDYVGLPRTLARRINRVSTALVALMLAALALGVLRRGEGMLLGGLFFVGWTLLFVQAMLREPHSGHGMVVVALLTFPFGSLAAHTGALPFALLPAVEIIPLGAIGLTVLSTGLIRAHRRAQLETEAAARELAARQAAESRLRAVNDSLEQRVAMRTAELRATVDGLESFNRTVSHDLRGPLGGIAGLAQVARELVARDDAAQADRLLAAIERQADDSVRMVSALLALARAGDAQPQRSHFDAGPLVDEAIAATAAPAADGAGATLVVRELPAVEADRELLRQVFVNLIGNARKFTREASAPCIEIGHAATAHGDAFFVRDNGVGFAPAESERLFRPFQRLHGARFEGHGVGLSIVRRIVDHHGGCAWAEGVPGRGATIWFTLDGR